MAGLLHGLFGGERSSASSIPAGDSDFADFAGAPDPSPALSASTTMSFMGQPTESTGPAAVYTKWYNIHERHSLNEFKQEGITLSILAVVVIVHILGTRTNRRKAKSWFDAIAPSLRSEYAMVGFDSSRPQSMDEAENNGLVKTVTQGTVYPESLLNEKSPQTFATYASGRLNVAFLDATLTLYKRYNPIMLFAEYALSIFFENMPTPTECMEIVIYPFDGREALTVPGQIPGAHELRKDNQSSYDGFVWAVVNKETMKKLRDDRYDVSITTTKDHTKLPNWATVMSESSEVTELLVTPELINAVEQAGELLEHLIITDQPIIKPFRLEDAAPKKRIYLSIRVPSSGNYDSIMPLLNYFLRIPDLLVHSAHFRPEVLRRIRSTRDELIKRMQKADEDEKAEGRALEKEKTKKMKRDMDLKGLDAKAQKKYLEKEKEKEMRKSQKRQTMRG